MLPAFPDARNFTFAQPIHGAGWELRRQLRRSWFAWTGSHARLELTTELAGAALLRVHVEHLVRAEALDGLQMRVNGCPAKWHTTGRQAPLVLEARVPAEALARPGRVTLEFQLAKTFRPRDVHAGSHDDRSLGIAVSRIELVPRARLQWLWSWTKRCA